MSLIIFKRKLSIYIYIIRYCAGMADATMRRRRRDAALIRVRFVRETWARRRFPRAGPVIGARRGGSARDAPVFSQLTPNLRRTSGPHLAPYPLSRFSRLLLLSSPRASRRGVSRFIRIFAPGDVTLSCPGENKKEGTREDGSEARTSAREKPPAEGRFDEDP